MSDRPLIADSQAGPGIARCSGPDFFLVVATRSGPNQAVFGGVKWSYSFRQLDAVGRIGQILDERAHERLERSILAEFAAGLATGALYTAPIDRG